MTAETRHNTDRSIAINMSADISQTQHRQVNCNQHVCRLSTNLPGVDLLVGPFGEFTLLFGHIVASVRVWCEVFVCGACTHVCMCGVVCECVVFARVCVCGVCECVGVGGVWIFVSVCVCVGVCLCVCV